MNHEQQPESTPLIDADALGQRVLSDVLEAALYRRREHRGYLVLGPRDERSYQAWLRTEAERQAFDLLEACRVSGMRLTLTDEEELT